MEMELLPDDMIADVLDRLHVSANAGAPSSTADACCAPEPISSLCISTASCSKATPITDTIPAHISSGALGQHTNWQPPRDVFIT